MTAAEDWIEDMGAVSATAFRTAVENWRRSSSAFKPSPGQLLAMIEKIEAPVRERLETAIGVCEREEAMPRRERLTHLHQRLYDLELGFTPYEVQMKGHDEVERYLASEMALVKSEIEALGN